MDQSDSSKYLKKYLKYKEKYRLLKESLGGNRYDTRYDRFNMQEQNMPNDNKMNNILKDKKEASKKLFKKDFEKWKIKYPNDYKKWMNKLKITNPIKYNQLLREELNPRAKKSRQQGKQEARYMIEGPEDRARQQALQDARKYGTKEYQEQFRKQLEDDMERRANHVYSDEEKRIYYQQLREQQRAKEERAREERKNQRPSGFQYEPRGPSRDFR